ncbi:hypothetical protein K1719_029748 [Acacia pycnantha]|nr:hypothetical protein K1719_029748 [Acacia pycnantha]
MALVNHVQLGGLLNEYSNQPLFILLHSLFFSVIVHGKQSCSEHVLSFLLQAYKRALHVYLLVYLIPALLVHRQGLFKRYT